MSKGNKKRGHGRRRLAGRLRETIGELGLTAYAVAKRAGVSVDAVQRFMNAERGLTLATVDKLADALELTLCPDDSPRVRATVVKGQAAPGINFQRRAVLAANRTAICPIRRRKRAETTSSQHRFPKPPPASRRNSTPTSRQMKI